MRPDSLSIWAAKEAIPLYQTLIWVLFALLLLVLLWRYVDPVIRSILKRIEGGSPLSVGGLSLGAPPSGLPSDQPGAVTTEGRSGSVPSDEVDRVLRAREYPAAVSDKFFLIHAAEVLVPRTTPGSGRYRVRLWVEADPGGAIGEIESVTYRLYSDFDPPVISTIARDKSFELWLSVYGEFNVIALVSLRKSRDLVWLTRYLDLPGRPPD